MDTQSFRNQLVEWMQEIIPYSSFDKYVRKTIENVNTNIWADRRDNHVHYVIYTATHSYGISAYPDYLGCIASTTFYRPGETWTRGNDLPDGKFCRETWDAIKDAILRYELVKPEQPRKLTPDDIAKLPKCDPPTPQELEYQEARSGLFHAQQRMERVERALAGLDKNNPDMPSDRLLTDTPAIEINE